MFLYFISNVKNFYWMQRVRLQLFFNKDVTFKDVFFLRGGWTSKITFHCMSFYYKNFYEVFCIMHFVSCIVYHVLQRSNSTRSELENFALNQQN